MTEANPIKPPESGPSLPPMSPEKKKLFTVHLLKFPARTLYTLFRKKTGFRELKPSHVVISTLLMLAFAYFVGGGPISSTHGIFPPQPGQTSLSRRPAVPEGLNAPLPPEWNRMAYGQRMAWVNQHRLTPQQMQERQQREAAERQKQEQEARAQAESAARWARYKSMAADWPLYAYALLFCAWGFIQRRLRWHSLLDGEKWHTYSLGVAYIKRLFPGSFPETYISRFIEPPLAVTIGIAIATFWSRALGLWFLIAGVAMFVVEQKLFEVQLDRELDGLDRLIEGESMIAAFRHFQKTPQEKAMIPPPSIDENGGILSTAAVVPDELIKQRHEQIAAVEAMLEAERNPRPPAGGARPNGAPPAL